MLVGLISVSEFVEEAASTVTCSWIETWHIHVDVCNIIFMQLGSQSAQLCALGQALAMYMWGIGPSSVTVLVALYLVLL